MSRGGTCTVPHGRVCEAHRALPVGLVEQVLDRHSYGGQAHGQKLIVSLHKTLGWKVWICLQTNPSSLLQITIHLSMYV